MLDGSAAKIQGKTLLDLMRCHQIIWSTWVKQMNIEGEISSVGCEDCAVLLVSINQIAELYPKVKEASSL